MPRWQILPATGSFSCLIGLPAVPAQVPLLTPLTAQQRLALCTAFASVKAQPGQAVVTQGDAGETFYIIEEGSCVVEGKEGQVGGAGLAGEDSKGLGAGRLLSLLHVCTGAERLKLLRWPAILLQCLALFGMAHSSSVLGPSLVLERRSLENWERPPTLASVRCCSTSRGLPPCAH